MGFPWNQPSSSCGLLAQGSNSWLPHAGGGGLCKDWSSREFRGSGWLDRICMDLAMKTLLVLVIEINHGRKAMWNTWKIYLVGGLVAIWIIFPYIGNVIIPIDLHIFQRGSKHQPVIYWSSHIAGINKYGFSVPQESHGRNHGYSWYGR